jgi:cerevisin
MGHGTHVAGTIGSKTYGIAKKTKLYAVKVLDKRGRGTNSGIIQGLDYVFSRSDREQNCPKGIVLNMSVGGPKRQSMNDAVSHKFLVS